MVLSLTRGMRSDFPPPAPAVPGTPDRSSAWLSPEQVGGYTEKERMVTEPRVEVRD